jgi:hypothetical protein
LIFGDFKDVKPKRMGENRILTRIMYMNLESIGQEVHQEIDGKIK